MGCSNRKPEKNEPILSTAVKSSAQSASASQSNVDVMQHKANLLRMNHDPAAAKILEENRKKVRFDWKGQETKQVQMITSSFKYTYDHAQNSFKIKSDGSNYTVSQLSWSYLTEYEVYSFIFKDVAVIDIESGKTTQCTDIIEYSFDASAEGKFVRAYSFILT